MALYNLGAICCYQLELFEKARIYAARACELSPEDERLKNNLKLIEIKLE